MKLTNANYFTPDCAFLPGDIYISGERFTGASNDKEIYGEEINCEGLFAVPGLIDIHIHGSADCEFSACSTEALIGMAKYLINEGVTSFIPTTMTANEKLIKNMCRTAGEYINKEDTSEVIGIHIEGPFISEEKRGAQNLAFIKKPDMAFYRELQELSNNKIKIITVAPEIQGAMEFVSAICKEAIISIAHSNADYQTAQKAFLNGASHVTHLFNGMSAFGHRSPGIVGAAFDSACMVELISDGSFVFPAVMRAMFKMFGDDRIIIISDGTSATGGKKDVYTVDGRVFIVKDGVVQLENGTLVGPAISMRQSIQRMVKEFNIPLESVIKCATYNPAKQLNLLNDYGLIREGNYADLLLLDKNLDVKMVFKKGRCVVKN